MASRSTSFAFPITIAASGLLLIYIGAASFSVGDAAPFLAVEGIAVAFGVLLLLAAFRVLLRRPNDDRSSSPAPPKAAPVPELKTVVAAETIAVTAFVERRSGGDRRQYGRRQTIHWAKDSDREGPGRRRNPGRRSADRTRWNFHYSS